MNKENKIEELFTNKIYPLIRTTIRTEEDSSNVSQYKDEVIKLLYKNKSKKLTDKKLYVLQNEIEKLTIYFDEKSIFSSVPNLVKLLIKKDKPSAMEYLRSHLRFTSNLELLNYMDHYTLEAIIIHVLGRVFNSMGQDSSVRVLTLIQHLELVTRSQASRYYSEKVANKQTTPTGDDQAKDSKESDKKKVKAKYMEIYPIGVNLVMFLVERGLIFFTHKPTSKRPHKKGGSYYIPMSLHAMCNFDLSLLPIKLNLPMVCTPVDWHQYRIHMNALTLSDLHGGYLSKPSVDYYFRYNLLASHDSNQFYIQLGSEYKLMFSTMNSLQRQPFEINREVLSFIKKNRNSLEELGILMPSFLASLNLKTASKILKSLFLEDESIKNNFSYPDLFDIFTKRIQRARSESFILTLASAYAGYKIYFPAFMDFRGRIYRAGVLHFHERDIARSLIVFSKLNGDSTLPKLNENSEKEKCREVLKSAVSFHYKSFSSIKEGSEWYSENRKLLNTSDISLIQVAQKAKNPFQFIANVLAIEKEETDPSTIPVTQDASSSAYQIMSYLLLDESLAKQTNLIPSEDAIIRDLYSEILTDLRQFLEGLKQEREGYYYLKLRLQIHES